MKDRTDSRGDLSLTLSNDDARYLALLSSLPGGCPLAAAHTHPTMLSSSSTVGVRLERCTSIIIRLKE